ncbi:VASCULAR-RELATED NAC-DOMAIN 6 [Artemisia annua]|uniref:VASCULAR-RELATED NAC-DOMAIN 6 n=1 Tax=Artemisia annua TaxID=35608 RepID=A0A2U1P9Q7_ARTAN|nr:VASCULAR-RELATED NAC-DOMAIN 6 [Artemisia annua]
MVSKRQILARRKFKQENPDLFPKPEPTPPKDPNKKKKKKKNSEFKRKKNDPKKPSSTKKHPLRIPGMKPGDSCFICKADNHIAKNCPEKAQWEKHKICLLCRQRGHSLKNCPDKKEDNVDQKLCYNCGGFGHSLARCPQPLEDGGTKYATCFICKEQGHLSKDCPKNAHGIYPKGGCCKLCGGVTHLARDCPNKGNRSSGMSNEFGKRSTGIESIARGQVTKFSSGDDLEDDFTMIDDGKEKKISEPNADAASNATIVKSKKKQGTKVVNFMG